MSEHEGCCGEGCDGQCGCSEPYGLTIKTVEGQSLPYRSNDPIKLYRQNRTVMAHHLLEGDYIEHDGQVFRVSRLERPVVGWVAYEVLDLSGAPTPER